MSGTTLYDEMNVGEDEDIFTIASQFDNQVVRRYAAMLRDAGVTLYSFQRPGVVDELIRAGIPEIPAGDIVDAFRKSQQKGTVGVFWDLENVGMPHNVSPLDALTSLRDKIISKFGNITMFKAYADLGTFAEKYPPNVRVLFHDCGVEIVDAPHNHRKEVADKYIIVDALWFAVHNRESTVCVISGDSDFSPLLSKLRMNGIRTLSITTSLQRVRSLHQQAMWAMSWPESFIQNASPPDDAGQRNRPQQQQPQVVRSGSPQAHPLSVDMVASPPAMSPTSSPSHTESALKASKEVMYADLVDCIRAVQSEVGMKKVKRSAVALRFMKLDPVSSWKQVVANAVADGVVIVGGQLGHAWIALASECDACDAPPKAPYVVSSAPFTNTPWWVCLRFNQRFSAAATLEAFVAVDPSLQVIRMNEKGSSWSRMALGPFATMKAADDFYQLNFGELQLLPKITQELRKYVDFVQEE